MATRRKSALVPRFRSTAVASATPSKGGGTPTQAIGTPLARIATGDRELVKSHSVDQAEDQSSLVTIGALTPMPADLQHSLAASARRAIEQTAPTDALERMLVEQLVWCHERIRLLSLGAAHAARSDQSCALHAQCDAAMGSYRRGILALRQYRSIGPPGPMVAVQQVNHSQVGRVTISAQANRRKETGKRTRGQDSE